MGSVLYAGLNGADAESRRKLPEKLKHTTWVYRIWGGLVRSRVICGLCKTPSDTLDHFLDLSLDVDARRGGSTNLVAMLRISSGRSISRERTGTAARGELSDFD